jgi:hypothetical protein
LGFVFFALAMLGVVLPLLPTTPFLLLALWAFSRGSLRLRNWLYHHPVFGPRLHLWQRHRVIPLRVKVIAYVTMAVSFLLMWLVARVQWHSLAASGALMLAGSAYIARRPSRPPAADA